MERKMLINAVHPEECRIAIIEGSPHDNPALIELEIEANSGKKLKGNVYKAKIARIEPSLQAAFVDIGAERNGFLQINDIHPAYFRNNRRGGDRHSRINIADVLEQGQELVVQVVKEERELKGATLTTYLSLPGRYVVVMPGSDRSGVSRKIGDSEQRKNLRRITEELEVPTGTGLIVRTAGLDRSQADLSRDMSMQLKLWERILTASQTSATPTLLYKESELTTRVIRDYFTPEVREILIDEPETFRKVKEFVSEVMPRYRSRVHFFDRSEPIFTLSGIDDQVRKTLEREVKLKSGGAIIIDSLEALTAIDVNSGKATAGSNIEETAYRTNLEAADEIARQLRLRDLGGLIVIDFIDMIDKRHKAAVEKRLATAVETDKARIELGRLSKFGLLEMSRQRLRASLSSQSHIACAHCHGVGKLRNPEMVALEALRKIQSAIIVGQVAIVKARIAPGPALFLLNNKKHELVRLETTFKVQILILADGRLPADGYEFEFETRRGPTTTASLDTRSPVALLDTDTEDEELDDIPRGRSETEGEEAENRSAKVVMDSDDDDGDGEAAPKAKSRADDE